MRWGEMMGIFRYVLLLTFLHIAASDPATETCSATGQCSPEGTGGVADLSNQYYWPQGRGHPQHYGKSPYAFGGPTCNLSKSLKWKWHHPDGRYHTFIVGSPIIDDMKNIYLAIYHGIRKFTSDGNLLWSWDVEDTLTQGYVMNTPAIMNGLLYDCILSGEVFALDMETGKLVWRVWVTDEGIPGDQGFVTARDGRVFLDADPQEPGMANNRVVALNGTDGSLLWDFFPEPGVWNFLPLFPQDGTMVFQTWNGAAYRVNLSNGNQIWRSGPGPTDNLFTDGGGAMGSNGVFYTVGHEGAPQDMWIGPQKPGSLRAFRISDGKLLWEKLDLEQGIFTYPVVGQLSEGAPLSVVVGVGQLAGFGVKMLNWNFYTLCFPAIVLFAVLVGVAAVLHGCLRKFKCGRLFVHVCKAGLGGLVVALVLAQAFFMNRIGIWTPYIHPDSVGQVMAKTQYTYSVQAFEADTGTFQWRFDLPPYNWYSAAGDDEGYFTRKWLAMREYSLPAAANYPTLDSQGIYYQGYQDGNFYSIKDWNNDGIIDKEKEVCVFNMGTCAFTGGPSIAPGMLAIVSSDGLFVFEN